MEKEDVTGRCEGIYFALGRYMALYGTVIPCDALCVLFFGAIEEILSVLFPDLL